MDMRIPPLIIKIMLESNPLKSIMPVRRLAVHYCGDPRRRRIRTEAAEKEIRIPAREAQYIYIYIYTYIHIHISLLSLQPAGVLAARVLFSPETVSFHILLDRYIYIYIHIYTFTYIIYIYTYIHLLFDRDI